VSTAAEKSAAFFVGEKYLCGDGFCVATAASAVEPRKARQ